MKPTGTIRLLKKRLRTVAVYGPPPRAGKRPRLLVDVHGLARPRELAAHCSKQDGRVATFLVSSGPVEDALLSKPGLVRSSHTVSTTGW